MLFEDSTTSLFPLYWTLRWTSLLFVLHQVSVGSGIYVPQSTANMKVIVDRSGIRLINQIHVDMDPAESSFTRWSTDFSFAHHCL